MVVVVVVVVVVSLLLFVVVDCWFVAVCCCRSRCLQNKQTKQQTNKPTNNADININSNSNDDDDDNNNKCSFLSLLVYIVRQKLLSICCLALLSVA